MTNLTQDAFLGGKLSVWQPANGYRAGVDPVLLAASVPAKAGDTVLELGCGVGVAAICLATRIAGLKITGVELQVDYADLARRNAAENNVDLTVVESDLASMPTDLRNQSFDHVIANPPYYKDGTKSDNAGRDIARSGDTSLHVWVDIAIKRLKPKGHMTFIQRAERLPDLMAACDTRLGAVTILPIAARSGRPAKLVIVQSQKASRAPAQLLAPLILHDGDKHDGDRESYRSEIRAVLRDAAPLLMQR
ncbi:tRNA1(Val) (adenine(37)-N6)-methyltransferase [Parasulfitobacter algicola]|uniref:Methyltransferase n=1 Tax=Parasulfitobacter algicola TaxID=2614809 RepID=A0ABX2IMR8_9RHOB|nr:methyltransferase [Sulfitobacter algicola]NSX53835.1 methyltransferase [Sulfitobacter algicola]